MILNELSRWSGTGAGEPSQTRAALVSAGERVPEASYQSAAVPIGTASATNRALIIDRRAVLATDVCRTLTRLKWKVDIFAESGSPAFRSRYCHRRLIAPSWATPTRFLDALRSTVESTHYDAIFLSSEELLEHIPALMTSPNWKTLLLPPPESIKIALSKNASIRLAIDAGVTVPRTLIPADERDVESIGRELGFPLVVKGERGEATRNVRIVRTPEELGTKYRSVVALEREYGGRPALQEFIPGVQYSLGGLFHEGTTLRVYAYRKLATYPINGGLSAKAITERPSALLQAAFAIFKALRYTGLGQVQFIRDSRDDNFKFIEINPRIWGCIGLAQHAGVDLYTPYRDLAKGIPVVPDLQYREGVVYHRFTVELRLILKRPFRALTFLKDCIDPRVRSDFEWGDPGPHLPSIYAFKHLRDDVGPG